MADPEPHIAVSRCWIHGTDEPRPASAYAVCFECGHVYVTPDDLVAAHNAAALRWAEPGDPVPPPLRPDEAHRVLSCQACHHDL